MRERPTRPELGARVTASGYMERYSTVPQWREANPDQPDGFPRHGFKTWKRKREPFVGVFVGVRRLTIKRWWWEFRGGLEPEDWFCSDLTPITFWLVTYSHFANPRYVLPGDVEVIR